ncbi:SGNH/GDSL hydrolase family protein [Paenibacillus sp. FSL P4-0113]|uniref:SGNH/GDSL hydrolase family protein n=1 Tax=Paenibacillus sp. FSL P4-0113 TaxID=2921630 RepID=UPI0030FA25F9
MTNNQGKYQGSHAVFLGDSITFGYELRDGEKPYPHLVSDALGFQTFENHGISGSSVASGGFEPMCERYEKMNPHADVIFLWGEETIFRWEKYRSVAWIRHRQKRVRFMVRSSILPKD